MKFHLLLTFLLFAINIYSQRGKDGSYTTSAMNEVLNSYTYLTVNASAGNASVTVNNASMNNAFFGSNLQQGDLIYIHELQGTEVKIETFSVTNWGGDYTYPLDITWGTPVNFQNSGNYEFVEVLSVSGNNITFNCNLKNSYDVSAVASGANSVVGPGHVVVIRVPRINDLTIPNSTSITCPAWDGDIGGEVILEVDGDFDLQAGGLIDVSEKGFRGGQFVDAPGGGAYGNGDWGSMTPDQAGRKGEGTAGYETFYNSVYSEYGKGAPANGGGGGCGHNSGGGGGANAGFGVVVTGNGIPDPTSAYNNAWNLELAGFAGSSSNGGGRGGYSSSGENENPLTTAPGDGAWGSDSRRETGGRGGFSLDYSLGKIWPGGGGGAGDGNDNEGGSGGSGGGIVYILAYGQFNGSGSFLANGQDGENAEGGAPPNGATTGDDGAGGAGAGGTIMINSINPLSNSLTINADGGIGGDNFVQFGSGVFNNFFASGPGGGGGGGYIAISGGSPTKTTIGGSNGISTGIPVDTEFPPNGATAANDGILSGSVTPFGIIIEDDTICGGANITLTASIVGAYPAGATNLTWWDSQYGGSVLGTGLSLVLTGLTANTTVYVGTCPGTFRKEVNILVSPAITITGTAVVTNTTCNGATGSITGLTAGGGSGTLTFDWNGVSSTDEDLLNASPNTYTLTVTDANGCTETSGPYTINSISGPSIDSVGFVLTPETCAGGDGSITGITSSGTATLTFDWNTTSYASEDITNATTGTYWLYVTDGNGCVDSTGPYNMTQVAGPSIDSLAYSITNSDCDVDNGSITGITATGTGTLTYTWNGTASANADGINLGVGSYTLVVTDGNGCQDSTGLYIVGQQNPPTIDSTNFILTNTSCDTDDGSITGITTSGNSPFTYEWNGTSSTSEDISGLGIGTYSLVVTDANGCVDSTGVYLIGLQPSPVIDTLNYIITDRSCTGDDATISGITVSNGSIPYSYFWNGSSSSIIDGTNLGVGDFTLIIVDANGCSDTTGVYTVSQASNPIIDSTNIVLVNSDCNSNTGEITGLVVSGNSPFVYVWDGSNSTLDQTTLAPGLHEIIVFDVNGCSDTLSGLNIGTLNGPIVDATNITTEDDHCGQGIGSILGLTVSGGTPGYTYLWDNNGGTGLDASNLDSASYQLTVTDAAGCTAFYGPVALANIAGPSIVETNLNIINDFCDLGSGIITGITGNGASPFSYLWSNGDTTLALVGVYQGTYSLIITDSYGCSSTSSDFVLTNANPNPIDFTWSPDPVIVADPDVVFTGNVTGNYFSTNWDFGVFGIDTGVIVNVVMDQIGTYPVYLIVDFGPGCVDTVLHYVIVKGILIIPNVMTTNGDGMNDEFTIEGLLPNTKVTIFNRWGNLVFETDNYDNQWSGQDVKGKQVSNGEYFYIIKDPFDETYQGSVRIITE